MSTGRHEPGWMDRETPVLDDVVRFVGRKGGRRGRRARPRRPRTDAAAWRSTTSSCLYVLVRSSRRRGTVFIRTGRPLTGWPRPTAMRRRRATRASGDVDEALAASGVTIAGTWRTQRVTHAHLGDPRQHRLARRGRLVVRTSSQVPFLTRDDCADCSTFPRTGAGPLRPGRWRFRREAGTADRGPVALGVLGRVDPSPTR